MIAYIVYLVFILGSVMVGFVLGYDKGQKDQSEIDFSLIEHDACSNCTHAAEVYSKYEAGDLMAYAEMYNQHCKNCAVYNTTLKY